MGTAEEREKMIEDDVSAEELSEYLTRKGVVELLCEIEMGGSRFNELAEALDISTTTLSKRLNEGQKVFLVRVLAVSREQGSGHVYSLTERGIGVRYHMIDSGTVGAYQMLREAQEKFEENAEEVREWAVENNEALAEDSYSILDFQREHQLGPFAPDDEPEDTD